jgi:hypothetical protein
MKSWDELVHWRVLEVRTDSNIFSMIFLKDVGLETEEVTALASQYMRAIAICRTGMSVFRDVRDLPDGEDSPQRRTVRQKAYELCMLSNQAQVISDTMSSARDAFAERICRNMRIPLVDRLRCAVQPLGINSETGTRMSGRFLMRC